MNLIAYYSTVHFNMFPFSSQTVFFTGVTRSHSQSFPCCVHLNITNWSALVSEVSPLTPAHCPHDLAQTVFPFFEEACVFYIITSETSFLYHLGSDSFWVRGVSRGTRLLHDMIFDPRLLLLSNTSPSQRLSPLFFYHLPPISLVCDITAKNKGRRAKSQLNMNKLLVAWFMRSETDFKTFATDH